MPAPSATFSPFATTRSSAELLAERAHVRLHGSQAGRAEHVAEEEDPHGMVSGDACRSSMCAWLPASAV